MAKTLTSNFRVADSSWPRRSRHRSLCALPGTIFREMIAGDEFSSPSVCLSDEPLDALYPSAGGHVLLTVAIALAGIIAFLSLPVAALPQIDYPTISVQANLPGASPEIMASSVATPLERQFGRIAGVTEMTSSSYLGSTAITLQFDLNRNIDGAARGRAGRHQRRAQLPALHSAEQPHV